MSNSLQPHGLQHIRLPCLSLSPEVCLNSCLLSQWCHSTISPSVASFSSCPGSFLAIDNLVMHYLTSQLPRWRSGKESACQQRRWKRHRFDSWVRNIPWWRKWQPYSCLENPIDRGAWQAIAHRVTKSWTRLKWLSMHTHPHDIIVKCNTFSCDVDQSVPLNS